MGTKRRKRYGGLTIGQLRAVLITGLFNCIILSSAVLLLFQESDVPARRLPQMEATGKTAPDLIINLPSATAPILDPATATCTSTATETMTPALATVTLTKSPTLTQRPPTPTFTRVPTRRPIPTVFSLPAQPPSSGSRGCCKICTTGKACGDSCISRNKTCHKGPGCACNG
ncbi:hypothetical protein PLCT2_02309 [Planctomycetaceae bacterium]|nr:hypothetical protein PLCT2_02309 [Planctomycetaceae bacterium]